MEIIPLSKENLEETIELAHKVFPLDAAGENPPEKGFRKSLLPEEDREYWEKNKLFRLNYWVLLDDRSDRVIGVTGLYAFSDHKEEAWLAWFCIDPAERGKGLGRRLLEWTMTKAKEEGYSVFKLYTSTDPNEAAAQNLYESIGLKITEEQKDSESEYKILYRQRSL
ncbi:MAG: GNAT family N-acetyltransferase [Patescibacteria group bacterium]